MTRKNQRTKQEDRNQKDQVIGFRKNKSGKSYPIFAGSEAANKGHGEISVSMKFKNVAPKKADKIAVEQQLDDVIGTIKKSEFELTGLLQAKKQAENDEADTSKIVKAIEGKQAELKEQTDALRSLQVELKKKA